MKEIDVHRLIEEQDKEEKDALFEMVQQKTADISVVPARTVHKQQTVNRKRFFKFASIAVAFLLVLGLAIGLPITLKKGNSNYNPVKDPVDTTPDRYFNTSDCVISDMKMNVKEYAESQSKELLFLDWYENAGFLETGYYVNKQDYNDLVYIKENIQNGDTGDMVTMYITDTHTQLEVLQTISTFCSKDSNINDTAIKWNADRQKGAAVFKYKDHKYYLELQYPFNETDILDIVESMF